MNKYAEVVVDISVADVDRVFDYLLPGYLRDKIKLGYAVKVPFGRRNTIGFIVGFKDSTEIPDNKIKEIIDIYKNESYFNQKQLKLFKWMAKYYHTYLIKVIKSAVPTGVIEGKVNKKKTTYYCLGQSREDTREIFNELKNRAPKQAEVLKILIDSRGQKLTAKKLAKRANTYPSIVYKLRDKGFLKKYFLTEKRRPYLEKDEAATEYHNPTNNQKRVIKKIVSAVKEDNPEYFLLHGVTGSGKTEVYLHTIKEALKQNKGAIVLVPEISLTPVMVRRFYSKFGEQIAVLHSNLSLGERYDEWRRIKDGEAQIVIGARSAIFAPVQKPGLIIIDEEHENSFKQGNDPYYHARLVAIKRAQFNDATVVLGSATPSIESFYYARKGVFTYLTLPKRINSTPLPPVDIVDMREELEKGNTSIFSFNLKKKIEKALANNEQTLLFLNRRGYASFVLCRECGHVIKCDNCDISLTYHAGSDILKCHYCDYRQQVPTRCPGCGSKYIKRFGIGTEKIEEGVKELFPGARVERMDVDTTTKKGAHREILKRLENGETDILVGTQMIAKGHDYPNISVVGVITADTILNLPDFRSAERTFQLLTQVAGRTGRGEKQGQVVIQTYSPDDYSIQAAKNHNYMNFYEQEIELRKRLKYPPFNHLANIIIKGEEENKVEREARKLGNTIEDRGLFQELMGPSPAPIARIRNKYRWQIIIKFNSINNRRELLSSLEVDNKDRVNINIDVDPLSML